ncbi:MAG: helix-turn-helix domain-containing protein [Bryobacteraceae bacterium]
MVGVSRQSVYAIEAGAFAPNTEIALKLARALDYTVEELFRLRECPIRPLSRNKNASFRP